MSLFGNFMKAAKPDALCGAIMRGDSALAKKLLAKEKIDLDATYGGYTALAWASGGYGAVHASKELVQMLLERHVNVNAPCEGGATALERAAMVNATDVVETLVAAGADVNQKDGTSNTPLMTALLCRSEEAAVLLIEKGTEVDGCSTHSNCPGYSPLKLAVENNLTRAAGMLLDRGASLDGVEVSKYNREMSEIVGRCLKERNEKAVALAERIPVFKTLKLKCQPG
ncbi:MAG: ankyrin repeat domain-containing protein [Alphaproteobacteria bacterium]